MHDGLTDIDSVETALSQLPRGVYVIGSLDGDGIVTTVADWVTQVSHVPRLLAVSIKNDSVTLRNLQESGVFTVSIVPNGQARPTANSRYDARIFGLGDHTGCPILKDAAAWLECRVRMTVHAGDHTLVISRVIDGGSLAASTPTRRRTSPSSRR